MAGGGEGGSYNFKVVLLGEGCVGKSSLVLRYVEDIFNPNHVTTIQVTMVARLAGLPSNATLFAPLPSRPRS